MLILLSNDDGIQSPGIQNLASHLGRQGHDIFIVAPASDRSTVGHSLTLHKPLRIYEMGPQQFAISGSPADCVYMATRFLMKQRRPDLIISGINKGANLGNDIFYSGTVAAAREGALFGIKSLAVSLVFDKAQDFQSAHWDTASHWVEQFLPIWTALSYEPRSTVMNMNVPNKARDDIKGIKFDRQGLRIYSDRVVEGTDPRNKKYYWLGGTYESYEEKAGTDCDDVERAFVAVTPLNTNTSNDALLAEMQKCQVQFKK